MFSRRSSPGASRRGFYLIGLLIVIAILFILYGKELLPDKTTGKSTQDMALERSKGAACTANRQALSVQITAWSLNHSGETATVERLRQDGVNVPPCPEGGVLSIGADGHTIYCSIHDPAPGDAPPAGSTSPPGPVVPNIPSGLGM
ncbi:hypothetical protein JW916_13160 [Candidatus Sumerlaeota bacterium]|nr:hypothetical protein [Candidatus Sumerlaeota bacterium]